MGPTRAGSPDDGSAGRPARHGPRPFQLLYVCTGNLCRSPFAEILTARLLTERLADAAAATCQVSSAGTRAVAGSPVHPGTRLELRTRGLDGPDVDRFRARQLGIALVERADLVLGATPRHRSGVVACTPLALPTAFSLREFARLAASVDRDALPADPLERAAALVRHARGHRGLAPPVDPGDDDIPDPVDGTLHTHQRTARLIEVAVRTIVDTIAPPGR